MTQRTQIEEDFAELCMFFTDGYHTCKMRFFLASLDKRIEDGQATDVEIRVMTMVKQFMNLTKTIQEGRLG